VKMVVLYMYAEKMAHEHVQLFLYYLNIDIICSVIPFPTDSGFGEVFFDISYLLSAGFMMAIRNFKIRYSKVLLRLL